ncbi:MAG: phage portal protein [Sphingobacteriales bacterium]|nr:MAG: phage portal protein [Sphingobacteriales bacterium]
MKELDPALHDVMDPTKRKDKKITDKDNKQIGTVKVARLPLAIQKKIVVTSSAFLGSPEISSTPKGDVQIKMNEGIDRVWESNKMDYKFRELVERAMSERQSAILWYTQAAEEGYWEGTNINSKLRLRARILSPTLGDTLYPVYDEYGDMIAFGRAYDIKTGDKTVEYFDLYTADRVYYCSNEGGTWVIGNFTDSKDPSVKADNKPGIPNIAKKIPVVYFQHHLAWEDVQLLIARLEEIVSKHADTNDYNGSPIMKATGGVISMSDKGDSGKLVEMEQGATLEYLTYNSLPESVKMEVENLLKFIFSLTHTPDISFENLKNLGYFSTAALKTMFADAHLNASHNERVFGEGAQRIINYIKAMLAVMDTSTKPALSMQVTPAFTYFLPDNFSEDLDNIGKALDKGIITKDSATRLNPLLSDPDAEIEALKLEQTNNPAPAPAPVV